MLQQTVVSTVAPRFVEFMRRFPSVQALGRADESAVLAAWSGLGYYSRARRLHDAARQIAGQLGGELPGTVEELQLLPGVGSYTARAVAAIAFGVPTLPLDGNAVRVLTRLLDVRQAPAAAEVKLRLQQRGDALVPQSRPGDFVQAIMDLGATVCVPRRPRCGECPLRRWCAARRAGSACSLPASAPRPPRRELRLACVRISRGDAVLLVRSPPGQLLAGTWIAPALAVDSGQAPAVAARAAAARAGIKARRLVRAGQVTHLLTHRELIADVFDVRVRSGTTAIPGTGWFEPSHLDGIALASFTRRVLEI